MHVEVAWNVGLNLVEELPELALTSHDRLGNTGRTTGFWREELAAPYHAFCDAGAEVVLASPKGGQPPVDPKSNEPRRLAEEQEGQSEPVFGLCRLLGIKRMPRLRGLGDKVVYSNRSKF